jgi:uncharacterized protein
MNAPNPKAQEPSMEEILASIRRIIADDQQAKDSDTPAAPPAPMPDEDDVLDLADFAEPAPKAAPPLDPFEAAEIAFSDEAIDFDAIEVEPDPPPPPPEPEPEPEFAPEPPPVAAAEPLISRQTDANVSQAFNLLAHTVLTNNARTLEDLVREMLRPMLKTWLDDNLPTMVERLVRAEIERVARGR